MDNRLLYSDVTSVFNEPVEDNALIMIAGGIFAIAGELENFNDKWGF